MQSSAETKFASQLLLGALKLPPGPVALSMLEQCAAACVAAPAAAEAESGLANSVFGSQPFVEGVKDDTSLSVSTAAGPAGFLHRFIRRICRSATAAGQIAAVQRAAAASLAIGVHMGSFRLVAEAATRLVTSALVPGSLRGTITAGQPPALAAPPEQIAASSAAPTHPDARGRLTAGIRSLRSRVARLVAADPGSLGQLPTRPIDATHPLAAAAEIFAALKVVVQFTIARRELNGDGARNRGVPLFQATGGRWGASIGGVLAPAGSAGELQVLARAAAGITGIVRCAAQPQGSVSFSPSALRSAAQVAGSLAAVMRLAAAGASQRRRHLQALAQKQGDQPAPASVSAIPEHMRDASDQLGPSPLVRVTKSIEQVVMGSRLLGEATRDCARKLQRADADGDGSATPSGRGGVGGAGREEAEVAASEVVRAMRSAQGDASRASLFMTASTGVGMSAAEFIMAAQQQLRSAAASSDEHRRRLVASGGQGLADFEAEERQRWVHAAQLLHLLPTSVSSCSDDKLLSDMCVQAASMLLDVIFDGIGQPEAGDGKGKKKAGSGGGGGGGGGGAAASAAQASAEAGADSGSAQAPELSPSASLLRRDRAVALQAWRDLLSRPDVVERAAKAAVDFCVSSMLHRLYSTLMQVRGQTGSAEQRLVTSQVATVALETLTQTMAQSPSGVARDAIASSDHLEFCLVQCLIFRGCTPGSLAERHAQSGNWSEETAAAARLHLAAVVMLHNTCFSAYRDWTRFPRVPLLRQGRLLRSGRLLGSLVQLCQLPSSTRFSERLYAHGDGRPPQAELEEQQDRRLKQLHDLLRAATGGFGPALDEMAEAAATGSVSGSPSSLIVDTVDSQAQFDVALREVFGAPALRDFVAVVTAPGRVLAQASGKEIVVCVPDGPGIAEGKVYAPVRSPVEDEPIAVGVVNADPQRVALSGQRATAHGFGPSRAWKAPLPPDLGLLSEWRPLGHIVIETSRGHASGVTGLPSDARAQDSAVLTGRPNFQLFRKRTMAPPVLPRTLQADQRAAAQGQAAGRRMQLPVDPLADPVDFIPVGNLRGSTPPVTLWQAVPPPGYVALGLVATRCAPNDPSPANKPAQRSIWCVHNSLTVPDQDSRALLSRSLKVDPWSSHAIRAASAGATPEMVRAAMHEGHAPSVMGSSCSTHAVTLPAASGSLPRMLKQSVARDLRTLDVRPRQTAQMLLRYLVTMAFAPQTPHSAGRQWSAMLALGDLLRRIAVSSDESAQLRSLLPSPQVPFSVRTQHPQVAIVVCGLAPTMVPDNVSLAGLPALLAAAPLDNDLQRLAITPMQLSQMYTLRGCGHNHGLLSAVLTVIRHALMRHRGDSALRESSSTFLALTDPQFARTDAAKAMVAACKWLAWDAYRRANGGAAGQEARNVDPRDVFCQGIGVTAKCGCTIM